MRLKRMAVQRVEDVAWAMKLRRPGASTGNLCGVLPARNGEQPPFPPVLA